MDKFIIKKIPNTPKLKMVGGNKQRNSRIELFRVIVTLFVLIVHMNGYFIGLDTHDFNFHCFPQVVVEALTCIAVNGFILITGFFGIKFVFSYIMEVMAGVILHLCTSIFTKVYI